MKRWQRILALILWGLLLGAISRAEVPRQANGDRVDANQVPVREEEEAWSEWLVDDGGPKDYHIHWKKMTEKGLYSAFVEGRMFGGREEYRAIFREKPARPFYWRSYHGLDAETFDTENTLLTGLGYVCCCRQSFVTDGGQVRIQATWIKTREAFKRDPRYPDSDDNIREIDWNKYPEAK